MIQYEEELRSLATAEKGPAHLRVAALDALVRLHPELAMTPVIYMTHDPSTQIEDIAAEHGGFSLLHKPFEAALFDLILYS